MLRATDSCTGYRLTLWSFREHGMSPHCPFYASSVHDDVAPNRREVGVGFRTNTDLCRHLALGLRASSSNPGSPVSMHRLELVQLQHVASGGGICHSCSHRAVGCCAVISVYVADVSRDLVVMIPGACPRVRCLVECRAGSAHRVETRRPYRWLQKQGSVLVRVETVRASSS